MVRREIRQSEAPRRNVSKRPTLDGPVLAHGVLASGTFLPCPLASCPVLSSKTPRALAIRQKEKEQYLAVTPSLYRTSWLHMEVEDLEDLYNIDASYGQDDPDEDEGEQQSEDDQEMDMLGGAVAEEDGADDARGSSADEEEDEEDEEEEEEPEGAQLVAGDCGPSPRARVSEFAAAVGAAVERAHTSNCPVCMDPWTSQGPHRIRSPMPLIRSSRFCCLCPLWRHLFKFTLMIK